MSRHIRIYYAAGKARRLKDQSLHIPLKLSCFPFNICLYIPLQLSSHSVNMNICSNSHVITFIGEKHFMPVDIHWTGLKGSRTVARGGSPKYCHPQHQWDFSHCLSIISVRLQLILISTVWMWAILPTFQRYMLLPSTGLKWAERQRQHMPLKCQQYCPHGSNSLENNQYQQRITINA